MQQMRMCVLVIACLLLSVTVGAIASIKMSQRASTLFRTEGGEFKTALALVKATKEGKALWDRLYAPSSPLKIVIDTGNPSTDPGLTGFFGYYEPYDLDDLLTGGKVVIDSTETGGIAKLASTLFGCLRYAELVYECDLQFKICQRLNDEELIKEVLLDLYGDPNAELTDEAVDIIVEACYDENWWCIDFARNALDSALQGKTGGDDNYDSKMKKFLDELVKKCQSEAFRDSFHTILAFSKVERGGQVLGATNNTLSLKKHDNGSCKQITLEPGDRIQFTIWSVPGFACYLFFSPTLPDPKDSTTADVCEGVRMGLPCAAMKTTDESIDLGNTGNHTAWFTIPTLDYGPEKHYYLQVCAFNPDNVTTCDAHTVVSHVLDIHVP